MAETLSITPEDRLALCQAKRRLERPTVAARAAALLGAPLERSARLLPQRAREVLAEATRRAVWQALQLSLRSLPALPARPKRRGWNRWAGAALGAAGGAFGLPGLLLELPASTILILRAIAEVARAEGERLEDPEVQLACVEVFALGGFSRADDAADVGYYSARAALASAVGEALRYVSRRGIAGEGAPVLVRLAGAIAARMGVVVSDQLLLTAIPIVGAAGGAAVNALFVTHFQRVATGHFVVRRLERKYGAGVVKAAYEALDLDGKA